jgi:flagellin
MPGFDSPLAPNIQRILRALGQATAREASLSEQLATGLRVNRAADAPAGIAIAERFFLQSRGSVVAGRNINDGITMMQTVDGGLAQAVELTQRLRELALQSLNGTNSASDRAALDIERQLILEDLERVRATTRFNGINLFTEQTRLFQVGYQRGDTLSVDFESFSLLGTAQSVFDSGGYTPQSYTPSLMDGWYAALGLDPANYFPGQSGESTVWSDRARAITASAYNDIFANAVDTGSPVTNPISINNASFEADVLGEGHYINGVLADWVVDGDDTGVYNTDPDYIDESTVTGTNAAYLDDNGDTISQVLSETYDAGTSYEFKVDLGDEDCHNSSSGAFYEINLYAGTTLIGSQSGNTNNSNALYEVTLNSNVSNSALNGQALKIEIKKTNGDELFVDNVRGTATPAPVLDPSNDATWRLNYPTSGGGVGTKTYSASGAAWTFQTLVDEVNADTAETGWRAQLSPINTVKAMVYNPDMTDARTLTLGSPQGSTIITVAAGTTKSELIDLVNAEYATTGVKAIEEGEKIRFLSLEDWVTTAYGADPSGDSTVPLFEVNGAGAAPNAAFSETWYRNVNFYHFSDSNTGYSIDVDDPFFPSYNFPIDQISLVGAGGPAGGGATTAEGALTLLDDASANFTLSVADLFIDQLSARRAYYGGKEASFGSALAIAQLTEDQSRIARSNIIDADFAQVTSELIQAQLLTETGISALGAVNSQNQRVVSLLLARPH